MNTRKQYAHGLVHAKPPKSTSVTKAACTTRTVTINSYLVPGTDFGVL